MSCLAEQAKILWTEVEGTNLDWKVKNEKWRRWDTCSMCKQGYHGVVEHALSWACWKTYVGRPEADEARGWAMGLLGNGLQGAHCYTDAAILYEAMLSMLRRVGAPEASILNVQENLAVTYGTLGREEEALRMQRDIYSGRLKINGEEHRETLVAALNYAASLSDLERFEEVRALMRKTMPVARRVLEEGNELTLKLRCGYTFALYKDPAATLDDLREAVRTLEAAEGIARRVLGGAHPTTENIEETLRDARAALRARETQSSEDPEVLQTADDLAARFGSL